MKVFTRLAVAVPVALLAGACHDPVSPPTAPTRQLLPAPQPNRPASFTLTGTVYESTGDGHRPLAGAPLSISLDYQQRSPVATTDAEGRYRLSASSGTWNVRVERVGYSQPCRSVVALVADSVMDVYVVADTTLSVNGVPASMPMIQPTLSGTVFERTTKGVSAVQGAKLTADFSGGVGWAPHAATVTDAAGRYLLCGVGGVIGLDLLIQRPGHPNRFVPVDLRTTTQLDIELAAE